MLQVNEQLHELIKMFLVLNQIKFYFNVPVSMTRCMNQGW